MAFILESTKQKPQNKINCANRAEQPFFPLKAGPAEKKVMPTLEEKKSLFEENNK